MTNKIKHINTFGTETIEQEITNSKYGKFIFSSQYTINNGQKTLVDQWFRPKKHFHNGYNREHMCFVYYGRKIDPVADYNRLYNDKLKTVIIKNIESFSDFDNLYCNWLSMDGNIYSITSADPLPTIKLLELWGSYYDLEKAKKHLETISNVVNIELKNNISQNWVISGYQTLYIKYITDLRIIKNTVKMKDSWVVNNYIKQVFGLEQFKYPEKQSVEDDEDYYE